MTRVRASRSATVADRLALHSVIAPSGCRIWVGSRSSGYGRINVDRKCLYAHRVSYEVHVGPIPDGYEIDHLCRRTACINPLHLQPVPPQINVRRGTSPGARAQRRTVCKRGHQYADSGVVRHGRRICKTCQNAYMRIYNALPASEILRRREAAETVVDLDAFFGVAS